MVNTKIRKLFYRNMSLKQYNIRLNSHILLVRKTKIPARFCGAFAFSSWFTYSGACSYSGACCTSVSTSAGIMMLTKIAVLYIPYVIMIVPVTLPSLSSVAGTSLNCA